MRVTARTHVTEGGATTGGRKGAKRAVPRLRKGGLWCTACDVSRVSLVRARAARAE